MKIKVTKLYAKQEDGTIIGATGIVSFYDKNNNLLHQEWFNGKTDDKSSYEREVFYSGEWERYDSEVSPANGTFEYELLDVPEKA
jgi:hypothetical protein